MHDAENIPRLYRATYDQCKILQSLMARYQGGSDPTFNAAVNAIFNAAERTELSQMLTAINNLTADWETNHAGAIGGL